MEVYRPIYTSYINSQQEEAMKFASDYRGQFMIYSCGELEFSLAEALSRVTKNAISPRLCFLVKLKLNCKLAKSLLIGNEVTPTSILLCRKGPISHEYGVINETHV